METLGMKQLSSRTNFAKRELKVVRTDLFTLVKLCTATPDRYHIRDRRSMREDGVHSSIQLH
jgi:hypothetical protein